MQRQEEPAGPLAALALRSADSAFEDTSALFDAVLNLIGKALRALDHDHDRARARALLDRAARILPPDGNEIPELQRSLFARIRDSLQEARELAFGEPGESGE